MDPAAAEHDSRLVDLLDQALAELRAGQPMATATWQEQYPDLAEDLPALLETMRDLDTAARTWRGDHTLAPERTGAAAAAPPAELPARVGRYEILGVLGAGGMGRVYQARDPELGRVVAVKVPHFDGPADVRARRKARFLREARAAAAVRHPHVCPIHDVGEDGGLPYVVMAFIEGQSLAERLRTQGRYEDPRAAVALARQVAAALEAVHAHGIIHRDLKPGNILLDLPGTFAHLADFGLARPGDSADHLTVEGELMGTPAYMAAEQATGAAEQVRPWTDVYSLGVVLYQMLTGRLPFEGPTTLSVLHQVASAAAPPPSHFRGDLDPALEAIVQKALARRPEERYRTARELAAALNHWADSPPAPAPAAPASPTVTFGADAPPTAESKEQTVVLSGLPDGQALKLSLPAGAKADVKVTMTGDAGGKRRKKRPWRVTVSISLSMAALLLVAGLTLYLNRAGIEAPQKDTFALVKQAEPGRGEAPAKLAAQAKEGKRYGKKDWFEHMLFQRQEPPSFPPEIVKGRAQTLQDIKAMATPSEIRSGKSLNRLVSYLARHTDRKPPVAPAPLDKDVLRHLNVTSKRDNLGLLRNHTQLTWPAALRVLIPADERTYIQKTTERLVRQATDAQVDRTGLSELQASLAKIDARLRNSVSEMTPKDYIEATRFLKSFNGGLVDLRDEKTAGSRDFRAKFATGRQSVRDLVRYMAENELLFAPSTRGDEAAYEAVHNALLGWGLALEEGRETPGKD